jgi:Protein of unknown function (DUF2393)
MGGLIQPSPATQESESNLKPVLLGLGLVVVVVGIAAFLLRNQPKTLTGPHPYASKLQLSNLKMSAAENFVGASVTYLDGTITNFGDRTVTHAMVHVTFKDSMNQVAQTEDMPLRVLQTTGPYPDAVDLKLAPLAPESGTQFRLSLEHVTADWNHEYPAVQITDVELK